MTAETQFRRKVVKGRRPVIPVNSYCTTTAKTHHGIPGASPTTTSATARRIIHARRPNVNVSDHSANVIDDKDASSIATTTTQTSDAKKLSAEAELQLLFTWYHHDTAAQVISKASGSSSGVNDQFIKLIQSLTDLHQQAKTCGSDTIPISALSDILVPTIPAMQTIASQKHLCDKAIANLKSSRQTMRVLLVDQFSSHLQMGQGGSIQNVCLELQGLHKGQYPGMALEDGDDDATLTKTATITKPSPVPVASRNKDDHTSKPSLQNHNKDDHTSKPSLKKNDASSHVASKEESATSRSTATTTHNAAKPSMGAVFPRTKPVARPQTTSVTSGETLNAAVKNSSTGPNEVKESTSNNDKNSDMNNMSQPEIPPLKDEEEKDHGDHHPSACSDKDSSDSKSFFSRFIGGVWTTRASTTEENVPSHNQSDNDVRVPEFLSSEFWKSQQNVNTKMDSHGAGRSDYPPLFHENNIRAHDPSSDYRSHPAADRQDYNSYQDAQHHHRINTTHRQCHNHAAHPEEMMPPPSRIILPAQPTRHGYPLGQDRYNQYSNSRKRGNYGYEHDPDL